MALLGIMKIKSKRTKSHNEKLKIYYVPSKKPGRSYKLIFQGLWNHPKIELTGQNPDWVFYHDQAYRPDLHFKKDKTVFIDFTDSPYITCPTEHAFYFKRSWIKKKPNYAKPVTHRPKNHHPIAYAIMDEFLIDEEYDRDIDFGCYLRVNNEKRKEKIIEFAKTIKAPKTHVGEINDAGRDTFDKKYLSTLKRSKIVLSCQPERWEGDSRTWETLANRALLFTDPLYTPIPHQLEDGKHCVFYNPNDLDALRDKINYYLNNPKEARKIAENGYKHAMKYHRTINRIDNILEIIGEV